jgi:hypothetical protein
MIGRGISDIIQAVIKYSVCTYARERLAPLAGTQYSLYFLPNKYVTGVHILNLPHISIRKPNSPPPFLLRKVYFSRSRIMQKFTYIHTLFLYFCPFLIFLFPYIFLFFAISFFLVLPRMTSADFIPGGGE